MEDHPTIEDFDRFLQRSPRPSLAHRNAQVVLHLLRNCAICRRTLGELRGGSALLSKLLEAPSQGEDPQAPGPAGAYNYDWAFARTERALGTHLAKGLARGLPDRLGELASLPEGEQVRRVSLGGRFANPELIQCLMDRSRAARYQNPKKTLHLAHLAVLAAETCTAEVVGGEEHLADLQSQAWGAFGNAQRICGSLMEAEECFTAARQKCAEGSGAPKVRALLLSQVSALRLFQRQFEAAIELTQEAERIFQNLGDSHSVATAKVQRAISLAYSGKEDAAIEVLRQALPLIDHYEDPYLLLAAHHNLARFYIDLDQPAEALALHYETRPLYQKCQDPLILLRATWLEGQLLREIGHLRNAEAALLRARQGFTEQGLAYEMAMVCLDLADVYAKLKRPDQLRQTIAQAIPIFQSIHVAREVLASRLSLQQATDLSVGVEE